MQRIKNEEFHLHEFTSIESLNLHFPDLRQLFEYAEYRQVPVDRNDSRYTISRKIMEKVYPLDPTDGNYELIAPERYLSCVMNVDARDLSPEEVKILCKYRYIRGIANFKNEEFVSTCAHFLGCKKGLHRVAELFAIFEKLGKLSNQAIELLFSVVQVAISK